MLKSSLILIFVAVSQLFASNNWEIVYKMENYNLIYIKSFSKDTFVLSTYYNRQRNGNITFENAIWLTTNVGESWKMIYQDSTSVADVPRMSQSILDMDVSENSIISFLREDGYILFSKDYGATWDSVKTAYEKMKNGRIDSYKNKLIARYKTTDSLYFLNFDTKELNAIKLPAPDYKDIPNNTMKLYNLSFNSDDNIIFSVLRSFPDTISFTLVTKDRGKTWKLFERRNNAYDFYFVNNELGYSCGTKYVSKNNELTSFPVFDKTTDGGETWENVYKGIEGSFFTDFAKNSNSFICIPVNSVAPISTENIPSWDLDTVTVPFTQGGASLDIACDDYGNCLMIQYHDNIHRLLSPPTSVSEEIPYSKDYSQIEYYDLSGHFLRDVKNVVGLNNGLYLKVYKDRNDNIVKVEKLVVIH